MRIKQTGQERQAGSTQPAPLKISWIVDLNTKSLSSTSILRLRRYSPRTCDFFVQNATICERYVRKEGPTDTGAGREWQWSHRARSSNRPVDRCLLMPLPCAVRPKNVSKEKIVDHVEGALSKPRLRRRLRCLLVRPKRLLSCAVGHRAVIVSVWWYASSPDCHLSCEAEVYFRPQRRYNRGMSKPLGHSVEPS